MGRAEGELSLDGAVCPIRGILPMILAAAGEGVKRFFVPRENAREAAVVQDIEIISVGRLDETAEMLAGGKRINLSVTDVEKLSRNPCRQSVDFAEVKGQEYAKQAMEVAAAGRHHILTLIHDQPKLPRPFFTTNNSLINLFFHNYQQL